MIGLRDASEYTAHLLFMLNESRAQILPSCHGHQRVLHLVAVEQGLGISQTQTKRFTKVNGIDTVKNSEMRNTHMSLTWRTLQAHNASMSGATRSATL